MDQEKFKSAVKQMRFWQKMYFRTKSPSAMQDISDEDCLREGVDKFVLRKGDGTRRTKYSFKGAYNNYFSPQESFAALIDKVSGKGTWKSNPFVVVYEFELVM